MRPGRLTGEQRRYTIALARGLRIAEIAAAVGVSPATVKGQLEAARRRLGAATLPELVFLFVAQVAGLDPVKLIDRLEAASVETPTPKRQAALTG